MLDQQKLEEDTLNQKEVRMEYVKGNDYQIKDCREVEGSKNGIREKRHLAKSGWRESMGQDKFHNQKLS